MLKQTKPFLLSVLVGILGTQGILTYAAIPVPTPIKTKYPERYKDALDELEFLIEVAEDTIYQLESLSDEDIVKKYTKLEEEGKNICYQTLDPDSKQSYLDWDIEKERETALSNAMTCFISLKNQGATNLYFNEVYLEHTKADRTDELFVRLLNLVYDLPKAEGHPLLSEFAKELRDSYIKYRLFYYDYLSFLTVNNEDGELSGLLATYLQQAEDSLHYGTDYNPDIPIDPAPITPPSQEDLNKTEDEVWDDLFDQAWNESYEQIKEEVVVPPTPTPENTTQPSTPTKSDVVTEETTISVINGVCKKMKRVYVNGVLESEKELNITTREKAKCGREEDIDWSNAMPNVSGETYEANQSVMFYRLEETTDWKSTNYRNYDEQLYYKDFMGILMTISKENGIGMVDDSTRHLFVIQGKPLITESYEGLKTVDELTQWLNEQGFQIELKNKTQVETLKKEQEGMTEDSWLVTMEEE